MVTGLSFQINATENPAPSHKSRFREMLYGLASFYNSSLRGLRTFNGEHYSEKKLTAAHKYLPMGTLVRVTDLSSNRSVIVRINDRLPQNSKRLIDLSHIAASKIHIVGRGLARVSLQVLKKNGQNQYASN